MKIIFGFLNNIFNLIIFLIIIIGIFIFIIIKCDSNKPFASIIVETEGTLEIANNKTDVIIKGLISKDEIYFNLFESKTGNTIELPSITGVVGIRYIGGGAVGKINKYGNGFYISQKPYIDGIIRTIRNEQKINLLIRTDLHNGQTAGFSILIDLNN